MAKLTRKLTIINGGSVETILTTKAEEYSAMVKAVGGYIETIPHFTTYAGRSCLAYCNEEGRLIALPLNLHATILWRSKLKGKYYPLRASLYGPIVISQVNKDGGE